MSVNYDIKLKAKNSKVHLWQIAEKLEMEDFQFSRKLRHELPADEKTKIFAIIDELAAEGK